MPKLIALILLAAAPKIAVLPFSGPGANAARNQVVGALCDSATCVPSAKVGSGPKPDWKKLKKAKVDYVVTGNVAKAKKKLSLELQVLKGPGKAKLKKSYPLDSKSKLAAGSLDSAGEAVLKSMGISAEAKAPEPPPERVEPVKPPPEKTEPVATEPEPDKTEPVAEKSPDPWARSPEASGTGVEKPADEPYRPKRRDPLFAIEAGPDLFGRGFGYSNVLTKNLRAYNAGPVFAAHLKAELYPLASFMRGLAAGFGLELGYAFAVGLASRTKTSAPGVEPPTYGPPHPTSATRLDVGARLRAKLGEGGTAIVPSVGYRSTGFTVGPDSEGATLDGLPAVSYSSVVLGVGLEVPAMDDKLVVLLRGAVMPVLSAGEITKDYFPKGSALGLEASAGAGYRVTPNIEVRLSGYLTSYGLTLRAVDGDPYVASGAADLYYGGGLALRYTY